MLDANASLTTTKRDEMNFEPRHTAVSSTCAEPPRFRATILLKDGSKSEFIYTRKDTTSWYTIFTTDSGGRAFETRKIEALDIREVDRMSPLSGDEKPITPTPLAISTKKQKSPDDRLIKLGRQLERAWRDENAAMAALDDPAGDAEKLEKLFYAASSVTCEIGSEIWDTPPLTLEGILVKARRSCYSSFLNTPEPAAAALICSDKSPEAEEFLLGFVSICSELLRLHPELKSIPSAHLIGCPARP